MNKVSRLIDRLPKAELHMHIEGAIEPEMMIDLAQRNGIELPWRDARELQAAYHFANLQEFLAVFYRGLSVLVTEQDFYDITLAYLERAHADRIVHAELFVSPQGHLSRGVSFDSMMRGMVRALQEAQRRFGMSGGILLIIQRHLPEENAFALLDVAEGWRENVLGFGLGGAEIENPPAKFERLFAEMRRRGFEVVAHAGEEGPAESVRDALDILKVARIDHGVRAADNPALVDRLAREGVPLTVCPVSNVLLGVFPSMAAHNLRSLLERGVKVTLNSDDPSYFSAYVNENFRRAAEALHLGADQIVTLVRNSIEAAFMPEQRKSELLLEVDRIRDEVLAEA